jgi:hypothetical protein
VASFADSQVGGQLEVLPWSKRRVRNRPTDFHAIDGERACIPSEAGQGCDGSFVYSGSRPEEWADIERIAQSVCRNFIRDKELKFGLCNTVIRAFEVEDRSSGTDELQEAWLNWHSS